MKKSEAILVLEELKDFLREIGCGDIYGILGHSAGGVLGNQILYNGGCYELDDAGNRMPCRLCGRDRHDIENVQNDMYTVINRGRDNKFIEKLDQMIETIRNS